MNKFKVEIDYEKQSFEDINAIPYEIVIAAAKYAREVNEKVRKYFDSDIDTQPRNLAMKKLEKEKGKIFYIEEKEKNPTEELKPLI